MTNTPSPAVIEFRKLCKSKDYKKTLLVTFGKLISNDGELDKKKCEAYIKRVEREAKEMCICAALLMPDGYIIRGHRHSDCFKTAREMGRYNMMDFRNIGSKGQGFVTSRNRFVTREVGRKLQDAAGIPSANPEGYMPGTLFSEDLY